MTTPAELIGQGYQARRDHRSDDAKRSFAEAVQLCREADDQRGLEQALIGLGQIERDLRDGDQARRCYEEAVAICRKLDDPLHLAHTVRHLADILREAHDGPLAESFYIQALDIYRRNEQTSRLDLANTIRGFALLQSECGKTEEALSFWREAKVLYADVNVQAGVEESDHYLSLLSRE
jgi:tetratricopeptide (TPR) repeat protein